MKTKLRIGLYGYNGHQIGGKIGPDHPDAEIRAVCFPGSDRAKAQEQYPQAAVYDSLEDMLSAQCVDMVSLCSPMRCAQKEDALRCIAAGVHVYAEKPAVLSEKDLDEVLAAADAAGVEFHEMADTVFYEPYWTLRSLIRSGKLGKVVQVYAQKCYPSNFATRPQDEETDGGLIRWVGIHGVRFIEHVTGLQVQDVQVVQTRCGNGHEESGIHTASAWMMTLAGGAVAAMTVSYLQPKSFPHWGKEGVRVFCTDGLAEITDGGLRTHVYTDTEDYELSTAHSTCADYLDILLAHLRHGAPLAMDRTEELHPLRVVLRAFESAKEHPCNEHFRREI